MYYFKSQYEPCVYSPNWFGSFDVAPQATVILYDDNQNICIGYVDNQESAAILQTCPTISLYMTQEQLNVDMAELQTDDTHVWFGERLTHRWDVVEDGG